MNAAKADSDILSSESSRDTSADAGLAGTRRTYEQQDGTGLLFSQIHYSDLLDDTVLDLAESVVILIEDAAGIVKVYVDHVLLLPRQAGHEVEIIVQEAGFSALAALLLESVEDFLSFLAGCLIHS